MLVNKMALRTQIEINAPVERVWAVMGNLTKWNTFNTFLDIQQVPDKLAPGQPLKVALKPPSASRATVMTPQVVSYQEGSELRWRGKLLGINLLFVGEHFFRLRQLGPDRTLLEHGEDFRGCLVPLLGGVLRDTEKGFQEFNTGLKRAVEGQR
ncbi:hypothetical protein Agub_g6538 [Astrephomene gubernaculifera]|uniref:SRPBCC domain-containing protein n=1 Tax=Astrephomene gubernaculifera TaxID=47775 RepID=A0AAD3HLW3_9CHLO|nr:hypothetical protein Agub_g6538 [Astrephomene gubernaculifera]